MSDVLTETAGIKHRMIEMNAISMSCSILRIETGAAAFASWERAGCVQLRMTSHSNGMYISPLATSSSA